MENVVHILQELFDSIVHEKKQRESPVAIPIRWDSGDHFCENLESIGRSDAPSSWHFECGANITWNDSKTKRFRELLNVHNFSMDRFKVMHEQFGPMWLRALSSFPSNLTIQRDELLLGLQASVLEPVAPGISRGLFNLRKNDALFDGKNLVTNQYCDYPAIHQVRERFRVEGRGIWELAKELGTCWHPPDHFCALCGTLTNQTSSVVWPGRVKPRYCNSCLTTEGFNRLAETQNSQYVTIWHALSKDEKRAVLTYIGRRIYEITDLIPFANRSIWDFRIAHLSNEVNDEAVFLHSLWAARDNDFLKSEFGSWTHYLNAFGVEVIRTGYGGYRSISRCNHECMSAGELAICNDLHMFGISHDVQPFYPSHPTLNPRGKKRADWKIDDVYVEFAGRLNDYRYRSSIRAKEELARLSGLQLIVLEPGDRILPALAFYTTLNIQIPSMI